MSAPEGTDEPIEKDEAINRLLDIMDDDRELHGLLYTGGSTEYAHIYLALTTGEYRGNDMLWMRYVWLSKPGAFESDMFGDNGISLRMVPGMADALPSVVAAACNGMKAEGGRGDSPPVYKEV
jgi:hypothetical protein